MARLFWTGAEVQLAPVAASAGDPEGFARIITGAAVINTTNPRSGAACYSFAPSATNGIHTAAGTLSSVLDRSYFGRACFRTDDNTPSANLTIVDFRQATGGVSCFSVRIKTDGTVGIFEANGTQVGSATAVLLANTYYRVEFKLMIPTAGNGTVAMRLDGVEIVPDTAADVNNEVWDMFRYGHRTSGETTTTVLMDDIALNDDQGTAQNSWCGDGKLVISKPISVNALGTGWEGPQTTGSDTTNLEDNVDNTPPLGVAHADTDANALKYVFNIASNAATDLDMNMQSYLAAGLPADAQVRLVQAIARTGSSSATDTAGAVDLVSNPDQGSETSFAAFDNGIAGTEPTNWKTTRGALVYNPALDMAGSPVVRVGKRTAAVRDTMVDLMAVMIEYQPGRPDLTMAPMVTS